MPIYKTKNENFFKGWTPEMAYVLGFFAADGTMIRNKRGGHFIEFSITDKTLLEKIKRVIGSNHKITSKKRNFKWKRTHRLQIGSKVMFQDLMNLGFTPHKSKTLAFPVVPPLYLPHFVRGYFDGDGNVTISNYIRANRNNKNGVTILSGFTSGSRKLLEQLHNKLKIEAGVRGGTLYHHDGYRLFFSVKDSLKLYRFLYKNVGSNLYLPRKKRLFEKYFKIR